MFNIVHGSAVCSCHCPRSDYPLSRFVTETDYRLHSLPLKQHRITTTSHKAFNMDENAFTAPFQLTKSMRRQIYPSIDPSNSALKATGKVVTITGAGGGLGGVSFPLVPQSHPILPTQQDILGPSFAAATRRWLTVNISLGHSRSVGYCGGRMHRPCRPQCRCPRGDCTERQEAGAWEPSPCP